MDMVYVLNKDGKPLMATTRGGRVRYLLKANKARVVSSTPVYHSVELRNP